MIYFGAGGLRLIIRSGRCRGKLSQRKREPGGRKSELYKRFPSGRQAVDDHRHGLIYQYPSVYVPNPLIRLDRSIWFTPP
jgi:hypothetical protein